MVFRVFFFSSRRRHTRWPRDWSSDVCSSDLQLSFGTGDVLFELFDLFGDALLRSEERRVGKECRSWWKLAAEHKNKDIRDEYNYPKKKGIKDECSRLLEASTMKANRKSFV